MNPASRTLHDRVCMMSASPTRLATWLAPAVHAGRQRGAAASPSGLGVLVVLQTVSFTGAHPVAVHDRRGT